MLEKALLELSEDPRNVKHSQNLLRENDKEINLLKLKVKIPGTHPRGIKEVNAVLKDKEAETQKLLESEERNHKYLAQIGYLTGKLHSLTFERILSSTKRVTAEVEEVTAKKALAVELQTKLNKVEMALVASDAEQRRLRHLIDEKDKSIVVLEANIDECREAVEGLETLKHSRHKV